MYKEMAVWVIWGHAVWDPGLAQMWHPDLILALSFSLQVSQTEILRNKEKAEQFYAEGMLLAHRRPSFGSWALHRFSLNTAWSNP